jgi:7,8-dihydroneopterin aldolase/epimerase/oxygenase
MPANPPDDAIHLAGLTVSTHIGVPESERAIAQAVELHLTLIPRQPLRQLQDDVTRTIDYALVAESARLTAAERPRQLIETLAEDIGHALLKKFSLRAVRTEVRKFILPHTHYVSVALTLTAP